MQAEIMRQEILEQPEVCARLFEREEAGLLELVRRLRKQPPKGIILAARGSSDHAAVYGRYLLEYLTHIPTHLAAPSLLSIYGRRPDFRGYLVIGISQSGQGPDINLVLAEAKRQGALTLGISNDPKSGLAKASRFLLALGAGKEKSVAATKTFSSELAALALLGVLWSQDKGLGRQLIRLPQQMSEVLSDTEARARGLAQQLKALQACVVLGRGFQLGVAHEIGLKLKECAGVPALSYSVADFAHGPISLLQKGFPVFLVSAPGRLENEALQASLDFIKRGASVYRVGLSDRHFKKIKPGPRMDLALCASAKTDEILSPLLSILPGQWLAYYCALSKGLDPSNPLGLKKVTRTI